MEVNSIEEEQITIKMNIDEVMMISRLWKSNF